MQGASDESKVPDFQMEEPQVCKEKHNIPGTNLGYSVVVLPKEKSCLYRAPSLCKGGSSARHCSPAPATRRIITVLEKVDNNSSHKL